MNVIVTIHSSHYEQYKCAVGQLCLDATVDLQSQEQQTMMYTDVCIDMLWHGSVLALCGKQTGCQKVCKLNQV